MRPRILHFRLHWADEETVCLKSTSRVRSCSTLANWDSKALAGGRRCPDCKKAVEVTRCKTEGGVE